MHTNHYLTTRTVFWCTVIHLLLVLPQAVWGQVVKTNERGDQIVEFEDGSWRYYEPSDSTLLFNQPSDKKKLPKKVKNQSDDEPQIETTTTNQSTVNSSTPTPSQPSQVSVIEDGKMKTKSVNNEAAFNAYKNPVVNPAPYKCKVVYSGVDEFTKRKRYELDKDVLFSYTDPEVAPFLKGRQYVTCEANLVSFLGDIIVMSTKITIANKAARVEFGYLKSGSIMTIKLLNGENVTLFSNDSDLGQIDQNNNTTVYKATYSISRENEKLLTRSLIDKIRIVWSTGYEEYEVNNVDFFQNQLNCINNQ